MRALLTAEDAPATFGKWYWIGDAENGHSLDTIYGTIADAFGRPYRPLYVPKLFCRLFGAVDALLGKFGRIHPTIHAAAKFDLDIAGSDAAARRDFGYTPFVDLATAAAELPAMSRAMNG